MKLHAGITITLLALRALYPDTALSHDVAKAAAVPLGNPWHTPGRYIVEGPTSLVAQHSVVQVGGHVYTQLDIIHGVVADLTQAQANKLQSFDNLRVFKDRSVGLQGDIAKPPPAPKPPPPGTTSVLTD